MTAETATQRTQRLEAEARARSGTETMAERQRREAEEDRQADQGPNGERLTDRERERRDAGSPAGVVSSHPDGLLHGRVDACICHGKSRRVPKWLEEGHAPECPARQPTAEGSTWTKELAAARDDS